jgi:hypothetical protein
MFSHFSVNLYFFIVRCLAYTGTYSPDPDPENFKLRTVCGHGPHKGIH